MLRCGPRLKPSSLAVGALSFVLVASSAGGSLMPLYTAITQEDTLSLETMAQIASEITRIHTAVMRVPKSFVRVVFLSYPGRSGYTAGEEAAIAALNCILRS